MNAVILELVQYYKDRSVGPTVRDVERFFDPRGFHSFVHEILGWIVKRVQLGAHPLRLDTSRMFGNQINCAVGTIPVLADLFCVTGCELDFQPHLSAAELKAIEEFVWRHYIPKVWI